MITSIVVLSIVSFVMLVWNINLVLKNRNQEERIISVEQKYYTYKEKHSSIISMWCNVKIVKKADEEEQEVDLENVDELTWKMILSTSLQDPNTVRVVSIFAGPIGIDRFMVGDILLGVLKTLTCGGLGILAIVDCFIIYRITQKFNFRKILNQF